jgi:hypothetical protein
MGWTQEQAEEVAGISLPVLTFVQVDVLGRQGVVGQLSPFLQDVVFVIWCERRG